MIVIVSTCNTVKPFLFAGEENFIFTLVGRNFVLDSTIILAYDCGITVTLHLLVRMCQNFMTIFCAICAFIWPFNPGFAFNRIGNSVADACSARSAYSAHPYCSRRCSRRCSRCWKKVRNSQRCCEYCDSSTYCATDYCTPPISFDLRLLLLFSFFLFESGINASWEGFGAIFHLILVDWGLVFFS